MQGSTWLICLTHVSKESSTLTLMFLFWTGRIMCPPSEFPKQNSMFVMRHGLQVRNPRTLGSVAYYVEAKLW
jgi:hypothetical protein